MLDTKHTKFVKHLKLNIKNLDPIQNLINPMHNNFSAYLTNKHPAKGGEGGWLDQPHLTTISSAHYNLDLLTASYQFPNNSYPHYISQLMSPCRTEVNY